MITNRKLIIELNKECNLSCIYCYHRNSTKSTKSPNNQLQKMNGSQQRYIINKCSLSKFGTNEVVITGGEPLLKFNLLIETVKYYKNLVTKIELITNGLLLSSSKILKLAKAGVTCITISLDSVNEFQNRILRGISPEIVFSRISLIRKNPKYCLKVRIVTTLSSINSDFENLVDLLDFVRTNNLDGIKFQPATLDLYPELKFLELSARKIKEIFSFLRKKRVFYPILNSNSLFDMVEIMQEDNHVTKVICSIPERNYFLSSDGKVMDCPISPKIIASPINMLQKIPPVEARACKLKVHCLCMF